MTVTMDADGHAEYSVPGNALGSRDNLYMRNQMIQTFTRDKGDLFQIKGDVDHDFDGFLSNIAGGVRYARRSANERSVVLNSPVPGGHLGAPADAAGVQGSPRGVVGGKSGG